MIINTSNALAAYQTTAPKSTTSAGKSDNVLHLEVTTFESLLSDSDKRTIAAMDKYAAENGISEEEMHDIKSAIMFEKAFAKDEGVPIPNIDRNLLSTIAAGADAGRLDMDSRYVKMLLADFQQIQGISITA